MLQQSPLILFLNYHVTIFVSVVTCMAMMDSHEKKFVEWVKEKASQAKEKNSFEAKSWLLTGANIYPNNISMKVGKSLC